MVLLIAGVQRQLYAYIRTLVGPWGDHDDILQEVNLVLCRKAGDYDPRAKFATWACGVAYHQVLAYLKKRKREKAVFMDESLLAELAEPLARRVEELDARMDALRGCMTKLPPAQRRLLAHRYADDGSVQKAAEAEGRPAGAVRVALHRIRQVLLECVERKLKGEQTA